jgi:GrpB-like predicted nucleotidyltransferase (UPF0157 family)
VNAHIVFRNYLRAHPEEMRAYEAIKLEAAAAFPDDTLRYHDAKSGWIEACCLRARVWHAKI